MREPKNASEFLDRLIEWVTDMDDLTTEEIKEELREEGVDVEKVVKQVQDLVNEKLFNKPRSTLQKTRLDNIATKIKNLSLKPGDHILFLDYAGAHKDLTYYDVLLFIYKNALEKQNPDEYCIFILSTDEMDQKRTVESFRDDLIRKGLKLDDYPNKSAIVSYDEIHSHGDIKDGRISKPFTNTAKYYMQKLQKSEPKKYESALVIAEVTSRLMLEFPPEDVLAYERHLKDDFACELADINPFKIDLTKTNPPFSYPMALICTFRIEHLQNVAIKGILPFQETIETLINCHDKVVALSKELELLIEDEAREYVTKVMPECTPKAA